ncbi:hypothetical protein BKA65DRAFT_476668 [Rhexocercosporidium sp. MPI-PUGE-AT-0058]|nr:hypothetical protein BKA65DRAFT_476668 [Rhexocercosporidium sp. MPI-PUGE-AT-0058]
MKFSLIPLVSTILLAFMVSAAPTPLPESILHHNHDLGETGGPIARSIIAMHDILTRTPHQEERCGSSPGQRPCKENSAVGSALQSRGAAFTGLVGVLAVAGVMF